MKRWWLGVKRAYIRYQLYVVPAAALTVVVVLTVAVLIPGVSQAWEMREELVSEREKLKRLADKLVILTRLDKDEWLTRSRVMEQVLPSGKEVGGAMVGLRQAAGKAGVGLVGAELSPGELGAVTAAGESQKELPMEVKVSGSWQGIVELMRQLEQVIPRLAPAKLKLSVEADDLINATMTIKAVYWVAPMSLGPADKPVADLTGEEEQLYQNLATRVGVETVEGEEELVPVGNSNLIGP